MDHFPGSARVPEPTADQLELELGGRRKDDDAPEPVQFESVMHPQVTFSLSKKGYTNLIEHEKVSPVPLPLHIKKEMLNALTLGTTSEIVVETLLRLAIENQFGGVNIVCYSERAEVLERFSKEAVRFLGPIVEGEESKGFASVVCAERPSADDWTAISHFGRIGYTLQDDIFVDPTKTLDWTTVGLVDYLNKVKLSTTPIELLRDLVCWMDRMYSDVIHERWVRPHNGDVDLKLKIIIGCIYREYTRYLDLVESLLQDIFYAMPKVEVDDSREGGKN